MEPDFIISVKITLFGHVRGNPPQVVATLELGGGGRNHATDKLHILQEYQIKSQAPNGTVRAAVGEFSRAVSGIFATFVKDIK